MTKHQRLENELRLLADDVRQGDDFPAPGVIRELRNLTAAIAARCARANLVTNDAGEVKPASGSSR